MDNVVREYANIQAPVATGVTDGTQETATTWRNAALRLGEELASVGPIGYYDFTAEQWLQWALQMQSVNDRIELMAIECEQLPFGDTAASFAAWIRGHKV